MNDTEDFIQRYGDTQFAHAEELRAALRAGDFFEVMRCPNSQPCRELSQIYRDRALMLDTFHRQRDSEMWREFTALADTLSESPDEPCILWMFRGASCSFSVFEMTQSQRIAGCLKRNGASERLNKNDRNAS